MDKKRRSLIIASAFVFIIILVLSVFVLGRHKQGPQPVPEAGRPGTVIIDNTTGLSNILLPEQYQALSNALAVYIQTKVDPGIDHATIAGQPSIAQDGSVTFTIKTDKPSRLVQVSVDRSNFDHLIMNIPSDNYSQIVPVFTSPEGE
jgi:hypothetical protein